MEPGAAGHGLPRRVKIAGLSTDFELNGRAKKENYIFNKREYSGFISGMKFIFLKNIYPILSHRRL